MTFTDDSSKEAMQEGIAKGHYTDDLPPTPKIKAQIVECDCVAFAGENGAYTVSHIHAEKS